MKKLLTLVLLSLIAFTSMNSVNAAIIQKPFMTFTIIGVEKDTYKLDILGDNNSVYAIGSLISDSYWTSYFDTDFPVQLEAYEINGLSSYTLYNNVGSISQTDNQDLTQTYKLELLLPDSFKIAIVMDDGTRITSEQMVRVTFETNVTWDLTDVDLTVTGDDVGMVTGDMAIGTLEDNDNISHITRVVIQIASIVVITLLIEFLVMYVFGYRLKNTYKKVFFSNLVTQSVLGFYTVMAYHAGGPEVAIISLIILAAAAFVVEILFYTISFKEGSKWKALVYTIVINIIHAIIVTVLILVV